MSGEQINIEINWPRTTYAMLELAIHWVQTTTYKYNINTFELYYYYMNASHCVLFTSRDDEWMSRDKALLRDNMFIYEYLYVVCIFALSWTSTSAVMSFLAWHSERKMSLGITVHDV